MNAIKKEVMRIEHHCLETPYQQLRLSRGQDLQKLTHSIERNGQLLPVVLVPKVPKTEGSWILMDGHLRVQALKRLGTDLIQSEIWDCSPIDALLRLLKERTGHVLEPIEEALWLREIYSQGQLSQNDIAMQLGRDKSWVNRRLTLLSVLPDPILQAMLKGQISLWVATRVLASLARANDTHAQALLKYLLKEPRSSREMQCFYEHYQQSNRPERSKMIQDPNLFFKAHEWALSKKKMDVLSAGPEGQWKQQCHFIFLALKKLIDLRPIVFSPGLPLSNRHQLLEPFNDIKKRLLVLEDSLKAQKNG